MMNAHFVLMILAVVCFLIATVTSAFYPPPPPPSRGWNFIAAGLFFWAFAVLVS